MSRTPYAVLAVLACVTALGIGVALVKPNEHMTWVFWGAAQLLPVLYIALAWWGSSMSSAETPAGASTLSPDSQT
jgi:hypothetical protein